MNTRSVIQAVLAGGTFGIMFSVVPIPLNLVGAALLTGYGLVRLTRRRPAERGAFGVASGVAVLVVLGAYWMPVKQLDRTVDPFRYGAMSLDELCQHLRGDHHVWVRVEESAGTNRVAAFACDRAMSRRKVLEKLAREAECDLKIRYCGTGATVLFGAHPSVTLLRPRTAGPEGTDPANTRIHPETPERQSHRAPRHEL